MISRIFEMSKGNNHLKIRNMKKFSKSEIIELGKKLAAAGLVITYPARSHSHNVYSLFPQTGAQYDWLRRGVGTTSNLTLPYTVEEVLSVCLELTGNITATKSGRFCRIDISL